MASDPIPCDALPAHSELAHLHSHFDSALAAGPVVLKAPDECRWRGAKPVSGMRRGHALSTAGRRECECERQQLRTGFTHRSAHGPARVECDDDTIKHDNTTQPCHGPRDTGWGRNRPGECFLCLQTAVWRSECETHVPSPLCCRRRHRHRLRPRPAPWWPH